MEKRKNREFSKKYISVNNAAKSIMIYMNKMEMGTDKTFT